MKVVRRSRRPNAMYVDIGPKCHVCKMSTHQVSTETPGICRNGDTCRTRPSFPQYRKHMRRGSVASRNHRHLAMMSSARVASPASDRGVGKRPSSICHGRSSGGRRANFRSSFSSLRPAQVSPYHLDRSGMICCCHKATIVIVALAFRLLGSSQTQKLPKRIQLELE